MKTDIKQQLYQLCHKHIQNRIDNVSAAIAMAKESAEVETKSSAGDKYETGLAMMQIEIENQSRQLTEAKKLQETLAGIDPEIHTDEAVLGSLIITDTSSFYLSVSVGKLRVEETDYFAVSPSSPIGTLLLGKKKGDRFEFNRKQVTIREVL